MQDGTREHFDGLFAASDDPWGFRDRWYERRKRALTLAALPAPRYRNALELGCANGELAGDLAPRCDHVRAIDGTPRAVMLASRRLEGLTHVRVVQAWLPDEWDTAIATDERFDLVVVSEIGFYFTADSLDTLADRIRSVLAPAGTVLACHWRPHVRGCVLDGDEVHRRLAARLGLPSLLHVVDDDLRLEVWCADERSVAMREGLRAD